MQIFVEGKQLAIKKGSSFEYVSENRLFSGADDYTLDISFPLKDCPENLEVFGNINRIDVAVRDISFNCEIRDRSMIKYGLLTILEISRSEVKCQFLEGRSEVNFLDRFRTQYINDLYLGYAPVLEPDKIDPNDAINPEFNGGRYVALPWINNNSDSGLEHNFMDFDSNSGRYKWNASTYGLSWQPYLVFLIESICQHIGYEVNIDKLKKDFRFKYILVCNTLPHAWDIPEFSRALPHWTLEEFFQNLESFLGGEFTIDHRNKKISFDFSINILDSADPVKIEKVIDEFSAELDSEESEDEYMEKRNLQYEFNDDESGRYYDCGWILKGVGGHASTGTVTYDTMDELLAYWREIEPQIKAGEYKIASSTKLYYVKEVDMYFILRGVDYLDADREAGKGDNFIRVLGYMLQPVNFLGKRIIDESASFNDLVVVPVSTEPTDYQHGFAMCLEVAGYDEDYSADTSDRALWKSLPQKVIQSHEEKDKAEYYDRLFVGWWTGSRPSISTQLPCPAVCEVDITGFRQWNKLPFSFRLTGKDSFQLNKYNVDTSKKYSFKFLADAIPDVRAMFNICGKRYICEKITATFTESGMSQLLKGDFYQIID